MFITVLCLVRWMWQVEISLLLPVRKIGIEIKKPAIAQTLDTEDFWRYLFSLHSMKKNEEEEEKRNNNKKLILMTWQREMSSTQKLTVFPLQVRTTHRLIWLRTRTAPHIRADNRDSMKGTMHIVQVSHRTRLHIPRQSSGTFPYDMILYQAIFSVGKLMITRQEVTTLKSICWCVNWISLRLKIDRDLFDLLTHSPKHKSPKLVKASLAALRSGLKSFVDDVDELKLLKLLWLVWFFSKYCWLFVDKAGRGVNIRGAWPFGMSFVSG